MNILFVSRSRRLLDSLRRAFLDSKHKCDFLVDGVQVLNADIEHLDILFIEEGITRLDYKEVIARCLERNKDLKIVLVSDVIALRKEYLASDLLIKDVITKPYSKDDILHLITNLENEAKFDEVDFIKNSKVHLHVREKNILYLLEKNDFVPLEEIKALLDEDKEEYYLYIDSINQKLNNIEIIKDYQKKGFKLVKVND